MKNTMQENKWKLKKGLEVETARIGVESGNSSRKLEDIRLMGKKKGLNFFSPHKIEVGINV